jgi:hypothetical protein
MRDGIEVIDADGHVKEPDEIARYANAHARAWYKLD